MKRVLLFATTTGYQIRSFGEAAQKLGVRLVFASDRCDQLEDPWWDHAIPVRFHDEAQSVEAVLESIGVPAASRIATRRRRPRGRRSADDPRRARGAGARASGQSARAARASRNKLESRAAFSAAGLPTPSFASVSLDDDPQELAGICIVSVCPQAAGAVRQPRRDARRRSRVVRRGVPAAAAHPRVDRRAASSATRSTRWRSIESFVPGREFAVEGLLDHGAFRPLAIFDKPDPLDGPFFEETIYVTPSRASDDVQQRIVAAVAARRARRSAFATDRSTRSAACNESWRRSTCWKWRHGRSAGCVRGRCGFADPSGSRLDRSRRCCCATRSARTSPRSRASPTPPA